MRVIPPWLVLCLAGTALASPPGTEYRWSTQDTWQPSVPPRPETGGLLLARVKVPELGPSPTASLPLAWGRQGATLDGVPLPLTGAWPLVPLPSDAAGRVLEVSYDTFSPPGNVGLALGSRAALQADFAEDVRDFAIGFGMLALGLLVGVAVLGRSGRAWFFFGAFSACMGLMKMAQSWSVYPLTMPFPERMLIVHTVAMWLVAPTLGGFAAHLFGGRTARWFAWLGRAAVAGALASIVLDVTRLASAARFRPLAELAIVLMLGLVFATVVPRARAGDRRARLVLLGMGLQLVFAVPELLHGLHIGNVSTAYLGTLALIGCLGLALRRDFADQNEALLRASATLEARVAELDLKHREVATLNAELRYQVTERSRELARVLTSSLDGKTPGDGRAPLAGTTIGGRYRLHHPLGQGAMGSVFEAERLSDGLRVALKVLHSVREAADAARFAREAEIATRASHANLVGVLDVGLTSSGSPFLVMEHVNGGTLASQSERFGQLTLCLTWLQGIAQGLEALHGASIVHRDLKPANILLEQRGDELLPRLSDFGLSRVGGLVEADDADTLQRADRLTRTGAFLGTPLYMAPEQATDAARVGASADVFSFGVIAYELLTKQLPFMPPAVFRTMAHAPIPPPALKLARLDGLSAAVGATLDACLSLDPAARPEAATLVEVLASATRVS